MTSARRFDLLSEVLEGVVGYATNVRPGLVSAIIRVRGGNPSGSARLPDHRGRFTSDYYDTYESHRGTVSLSYTRSEWFSGPR